MEIKCGLYNGKNMCSAIEVNCSEETRTRERCSFYQTEQELADGRERAKVRIRSLPNEFRSYIMGKYPAVYSWMKKEEKAAKGVM